MKKKLVVALVLGAIVCALAIPTFVSAKRKPFTAQAGSIALVQADPALGDWVDFAITYPGTASAPQVAVVCSQSGDPVFSSIVPAGDPVRLGGVSSEWLANGGGADCTATLFDWDWHPVQTQVVYAETTFTAAGSH